MMPRRARRRLKTKLQRIREQEGVNAARVKQRQEAGKAGKRALRAAARALGRQLSPWVTLLNETGDSFLRRTLRGVALDAMVSGGLLTPAALETRQRSRESLEILRPLLVRDGSVAALQQFDAMTQALDHLPQLSARAFARLRCCPGCDRFFADMTDGGVQTYCEEACEKRWKRRPRRSQRLTLVRAP
jgi:hypothetical protein